MVKIYIVSQDKKLMRFLKNLLTENAYTVTIFTKGTDAILEIDKNLPDITIVDRALKDINSKSFCNQVKKAHPELPILLIFENVSVNKVIKHYKAGADDFIEKPIDIEKLLSRIKMQLTFKGKSREILKVDSLELNTRTLQVKRDGKRIELTPTEFRLLKFLMQNKGRVLSRDIILSRVWSYDTDVETRVVDVNIGYLRKKINKGFSKKLIRTVRGFGYKIRK